MITDLSASLTLPYMNTLHRSTGCSWGLTFTWTRAQDTAKQQRALHLATLPCIPNLAHPFPPKAQPTHLTHILKLQRAAQVLKGFLLSLARLCRGATAQFVTTVVHRESQSSPKCRSLS